jgi:hypothetical protein
MKSYNRDDLDEKALKRLLDDNQLGALSDLVFQASVLLFDSVAGPGCWQSEFTEDERRIICQRIIVRIVGELFKPDHPRGAKPSTLH